MFGKIKTALTSLFASKPKKQAQEAPTLSAREIALVKESWAKVIPISEKAADLFYGKLFELDPNLKPLFGSDMKEQGRKLMALISTAVGSLDKLDTVAPSVKALGERHIGYGVKDKDYATVGAALLWTLERGLGEAFTPEVKTAWSKVYGVLAGVMMKQSS